MRRLAPLLLAALLATPALAQGITITRPGTPPASSSPAAVPSLEELPAGWRLLSGRIRAPREVRLPAGSTVTVSLVDVTGTPSPTLLEVNFPATRLSTPYQLQFNPVRLNARRVYAVTARVTGPNGRLLYASSTRQALPNGRNAVMDLRVTPVR